MVVCPQFSAAPVASDAMLANAQILLDQVKADLNLTQGEVTMWIPDMPNVPPQNLPVMIAQANQAQTGGASSTRVVGVCQPAPSLEYTGDNTLSPIGSAQDYLYSYEQKSVTGAATVTILKQPQHGILRMLTEADRGTLFSSSSGPIDPADPGYAYLPEQNYGKDSATLLVDFGGGIKVKVVYFFQQNEGPLGNTGLEDLCAKTGIYWKISATLAPNGTSTITSVEYQTPAASVASASTTDVTTLTSWINTAKLDSKVAGYSGTSTSLSTGITVTVADLPALLKGPF